ncbi:hypothetical protein V8E54_011465 [Elaphomyces granulatus]
MKFPVAAILLCIIASLHAVYGCKCWHNRKNFIQATKRACRAADGRMNAVGDCEAGTMSDRLSDFWHACKEDFTVSDCLCDWGCW